MQVTSAMYSSSAALVVWIACCCFCLCIATHGRILSVEEDLELENQLRIINKPALKTIKTVYGDIYGCVDFYQQPAFDHPALKNHNYHPQMRPSSYPKRGSKKERSHSPNFHKPSNIWLNGEGCPKGTVPIKRTTKDDLIRANLAANAFSSDADQANSHTAILETRTDGSGKYNGGGMLFSIWNPAVGAGQYSSSRIKIQGGSEIIQSGWMVNQDVNKDTRTHVFIYTQSPKGGSCFNTLCPGFVLVNSDLPVDMYFNKTSHRGDRGSYETNLFIFRDVASGAWYLEFGLDYGILGFWPPQIFSILAGEAPYVSWGGEVVSPQGQPLPAMGSGGSSLVEDTRYDAYCANITVVDKNHNIVEPSDVDKSNDLPQKYFVVDEGNVGGRYGRLLLFGGPGDTRPPLFLDNFN